MSVSKRHGASDIIKDRIKAHKNGQKNSKNQIPPTPPKKTWADFMKKDK